MIKTQFRLASCFGLMAVLLAGCTAFDAATGRAKKSPDEFQVVVNPPLTLPPGFSFEPLTEDDTKDGTRSATAASVANRPALGTTGTGTAGTAAGFDAIFGTEQIEDNIRDKVDTETLGIQIDRRLPHQALFGGKPPDIGPVLSAEEEAARIRDARLRGESLTATPTPAYDPFHKEPVAIE